LEALAMTHEDRRRALATDLRRHADMLELIASMLQELIHLANSTTDILSQRTSELAENVSHVGTHSSRLN
jgi:hypothetical protein